MNSVQRFLATQGRFGHHLLGQCIHCIIGQVDNTLGPVCIVPTVSIQSGAPSKPLASSALALGIRISNISVTEV